MTSAEYREFKEMEIRAMTERLKGIIETENGAADEGCADGLETISDNGRLIADPVLMRRAAERFHELFWDDEQVRELAMDAADRAIRESVAEPAKEPPFSIVRDGKTITLTDDEVEAMRRSFLHDEVSSYLDGWLENLEYEADDAVDPQDNEARRILALLEDRGAKERIVATFDETMMDSCMPIFSEDENSIMVWEETIDALFRPLARVMIRESKG